MAKRPKMPRDPNELAAKLVRIISQAAVALSALGASKGGKVRASKLSKAKRAAIAKKAAARWRRPAKP